jgi:hypothetical protein
MQAHGKKGNAAADKEIPRKGVKDIEQIVIFPGFAQMVRR